MLEFRYKGTSGMREEELSQKKESILPYRGHLKEVVQSGGYGELEASLNLVSDDTMTDLVEDTTRKLQNESLKYIVVIGIGGSNLGTYALYDALKSEQNLSKLFFLDTVDANHGKEVLDKLSTCQSLGEFILFVVSKSGKTTETVANAAWIYDELTEKFGNISSRVICITDKGSELATLAERENFLMLPIPDLVGGRYSVFSPVGLLPLALAGVNTRALVLGARQMRDACLFSDWSDDTALLSAVVANHSYEKGKTISNLFIFHSSLETIGAWWRQLVGESLGKEVDVTGTEVHAGITPIVSVGSTDLHSVGQLYLGGPENIFTTFLSVKNRATDQRIPDNTHFSALVPEIRGKYFSDILDAILRGVKSAYQKKELPFTEMIVEQVNAENVGAFLQMKMLETMYLGKLMRVNAFDQPAVESYKSETRKILRGE